MIMVHEEVIFKNVTTWDRDPIIRLYQDAGWWKESYDPNEIPHLIRSSFQFIVGLSSVSHETIAMGRIISDGFQGMVHDVCVLSTYRGRGIGSELLMFLTQSAITAGLIQIILVAEPGTELFYQKSGFISDKNKIFLLRTSQELP